MTCQELQSHKKMMLFSSILTFSMLRYL